jgi:hypothetical protein
MNVRNSMSYSVLRSEKFIYGMTALGFEMVSQQLTSRTAKGDRPFLTSPIWHVLCVQLRQPLDRQRE